jgi:transposase
MQSMKSKLSRFYRLVFEYLNLSQIDEYIPSVFGPKGYSRHALLKSFIVMKLQSINQITDLKYFIENNHSIAQLCGFDLSKSLPSYSVFQRYIKNLDNNIISQVMTEIVSKLIAKNIISTDFIAIDSTPIFANTKYNNPKCFSKNKFNPNNIPKADKDCRLGIFSASNENKDKNYKFYWGYKNTILCDPKSGLPIYEYTTIANEHDSKHTIDVLKTINNTFNIIGANIIADKAYDSKKIHNFIRFDLNGFAYISRNIRNTKHKITIPAGNVICEAGLAMHKDGKQYYEDRIKQKFCCPFKRSPHDDSCPCNHEKYLSGKKYRGCTRYITVGTDYRSSIDTKSSDFKKVYSLRTAAERLNSRVKSLCIESPSVRNINSIRNMNTISNLCVLICALLAVGTNHSTKLNCIKELKNLF